MATDLAEKTCIPCRGGVPPLTAQEIEPLLTRVDGWSVEDNKRLKKTFKFNDFMGSMGFANKIAEVAEQQAHHPDLYVAWGKVEVIIWTHKIDGLTESDFILAAKVDRINR